MLSSSAQHNYNVEKYVESPPKAFMRAQIGVFYTGREIRKGLAIKPVPLFLKANCAYSLVSASATATAVSPPSAAASPSSVRGCRRSWGGGAMLALFLEPRFC